ncbi:MAG: Bax inhibitor-1/YccA family protein [Saprospiraceae bacterium]|nr:Bax inhibitor-1/YccA family protein [Saprospiraceae bacterium]
MTDTRTSDQLKQYISQYITKVYGWMFLALTLTAVSGYYVSSSEVLLNFIVGNRIGFWVVLIGQLFLVGYLSARIHRMSVQTATILFFVYALLNGLVFGILFLVYTPASLLTVFGITAGTFGVMSAVGYFTKQDLTGFGQLMFFGLIGLIIASVVNYFVQSETLYWILSYVGVAVFVGLIAYDTQKIKAYALLNNEEDRKKGAILGALALYLDFINLFIYLLRLFGSRK